MKIDVLGRVTEFSFGTTTHLREIEGSDCVPTTGKSSTEYNRTMLSASQ